MPFRGEPVQQQQQWQQQQQRKHVHRNVCDSSLILTPRTNLVIVLWISCDIYSVLSHWHGTNAVGTIQHELWLNRLETWSECEWERGEESVSIMQSSVCIYCVWVIYVYGWIYVCVNDVSINHFRPIYWFISVQLWWSKHVYLWKIQICNYGVVFAYMAVLWWRYIEKETHFAVSAPIYAEITTVCRGSLMDPMRFFFCVSQIIGKVYVITMEIAWRVFPLNEFYNFSLGNRANDTAKHLVEQHVVFVMLLYIESMRLIIVLCVESWNATATTKCQSNVLERKMTSWWKIRAFIVYILL